MVGLLLTMAHAHTVHPSHGPRANSHSNPSRRYAAHASRTAANARAGRQAVQPGVLTSTRRDEEH